ncbi:3-hydroxyacyl-CoA dehydrogenase NAD-binding domain-containing protein [Kocuria sp. SM24M-10]|uniref:3-hydroxyacyl-CoA dehydrogenase NAD-binding domain-containing protein n=1 Tax=Kocuria sp. SM24M-10 TaxID=1660349 RepID=UPI000649CA0F|nr:3-hydroxyacyl-CoA dehydrogenase NAD-binding domain-containing protein [Kocuria sp. SM24M-10]KLU09685.1 fatty oxidation complex subunit alpha [Kocuria sp. SM24M-10]
MAPAPHAPSFPSTVTVAVEHLVLPGRHLPSALVRLDSTQPGGLIIWGSEALGQLRDVLRSVDQSAVEAIVVTGNARSFGAGADLKEIRHAQLSGVSASYVGLGHEAFGILADAEVPTFSLLTGQALGGGLELALHTDHRVAHPRTGPLGLPECRLGFFPGWGGVHLLPHLVGPAAALRIIVFDSLRGRHVKAREAQELGLVDVVLDAAPGTEQWDPAWQRWVAGRLAALDAGEPRRRPGAPGRADDREWQEAVEQARVRAERTWHGAAPAPLVAIDLVADARTESRTENGAKAVAAFAELVRGDVAKASLYAFELVSSRSRRAADVPEAAPKPLRKAAVIGAGLMAGQLASLIAGGARIPVVMTDLDDERLAAGVARTRERFAAQAAKGRITAEQAEQLGGLITAASGPEDLADADLVIEAVFEDLDVKKAVFAQWEKVVRPDTVLATNTSSLSVTAMAEGLRHPERVVGFHVFNPVEVTPLLEIVAGERTGDVALATAFDLAATLRRTAVRVQDAPGFVVNRVLTRMFDVVVRAVDAGADVATADHAPDPLGLPMTPLRLLDFVGPAVLHHVGGTMQRAYPERFARSPWMDAVVEAGLTHVLPTERAPETGADGYLAAEAARLLERTRAEHPELAAHAPASAEELLARIQDALAEEIGAMLAEGVVAGPEDVDLCMILGANYPFHLGGITPYLDRTGAAARVLGRRFHQD